MNKEDQTFKEAHRSMCLNFLKDDIKQAHLKAYNYFDYNDSRDITRVVLKAVRTALESSYNDITGEELFPEDFASVWNKIKSDSLDLDELMKERPF